MHTSYGTSIGHGTANSSIASRSCAEKFTILSYMAHTSTKNNDRCIISFLKVPIRPMQKKNTNSPDISLTVRSFSQQKSTIFLQMERLTTSTATIATHFTAPIPELFAHAHTHTRTHTRIHKN